jgi:Arginase/agmatinase/formimionoglutamate hydrolase, arginase family
MNDMTQQQLLNAAAVERRNDRVGNRVLSGDHIKDFAQFTARAAEKRTPCLTEPDLFFDPHTVDEAKKRCHGCPMIDACLNFALDARQVDGVWGGLDETERRRLLKARRSAKQRHWKRQREARAAAAQSDTLFEMSA